MRAIAIMSAAALCLAGCAGNGSNISTSASTVSADLAAVEAEAATLTKTACAFVPTASTIAGIVIPIVTSAAGAGSPIAIEGVASQAAEAICNAVGTKSARRGGVFAPHVGNVPIHGRFLSGGRI